jgi:hypothetical protein
MLTGDFEKANGALSPENLAAELNDRSNDPNLVEKYQTLRKAIEPLFKGIQIFARKTIDNDRVELKVRTTYDTMPGGSAPPEFTIQPIGRYGNEWKLMGSTREDSADWDSGGTVEILAP